MDCGSVNAAAYGGKGAIVNCLNHHGTLPFTGIDLLWFVLGALLALAIGAWLLR